ncbi:MAG: FecR domain-containing protein [Desulfitobacterium sp.]
MRKKMVFGLVLVMLFSLFPQLMVFSLGSETALAAGTSLATLEDISGGVFVKKGGGVKEFQAFNGMALIQGDSVRTAKEGSATVAFYTGSKMAVGPSTSFTVNKLQETKGTGGKLSVKLKSGTVWNKVKSLVNVEDEYEIETPTAVMGVRGTLFMVSVDPATGGQSTTSVFEGSIRADYAAASRGPGSSNQASQLLQMGQSGTVLPPQRTPGSSIYNPQFPAAPPPPPPPQPIDTQSLVQNQAPSILANMAMDMVDRMQEMQRQNEALMASYQNTNNPAFLQSALQQSQVNSLLGSLNQQYMSAVQGSPQEQQMNQFLQQQNRNMDTLRQQAQQLQEQAQQMRNNTENAAQQAGLSPDQIQRLLQNAVTASAAAGAGTSRTAPPPVVPPAQPNQPNQPVPSTPPTSGGGGSNSDDDNGDDDYEPIVPEKIQLIGIGDIIGTVRVGETLTAGTVSPDVATVTYQWQIAENTTGTSIKIDGANKNQYTLSANDANKYIRVAATGTGDYTGTVISMQTVPVAEAIPTAWSLPEPSVSIDTAGDEPLIIVEYKANQSGIVYYMAAEKDSLSENDPLLNMLTNELGNENVIFRGSEECSSEVEERLELPYSDGIYANKDYDLYMVLKGVNDYSAIKKITFHTPEDNNPPVLTATAVYNNDSNEVVINHSVQDNDELYDLYVQIVPKDMDPQPTPDELAVKDYGINNGMAYTSESSRTENVVSIDLENFQPGEYLVYLVAQDYSSAGGTRDGLFSEVLQILVTKPSPSTT